MIRKAIISIAVCASVISGAIAFPARAGVRADLTPQEVKQNQVKDIKSKAEGLYLAGKQAYENAEYDRARRNFDEAVDVILVGSIDIRSDDDLRAYYRELIEKINRHQIAALEQKDGGFNEQRYEPSPLDKIASLSEADLEEVASDDNPGEEVVARFNFKFTTSQAVRQFINYFTKGRGRSTMEAGLYRSSRYRAMAEGVFKQEGVPTDLIWLAQVESGWNPYAVSWAAAKGIWQFIPSTGVRFGLTQNYWVDERSNPEKSTRAAAKYLKWLSDRYKGDWMLALAAYNTGEGNIDSAISRSGSRDFWQIHRGGYIAQETRNYVPAILAVITIAKSPKKFGFEVPPTYPMMYETRMVAAQTDLRPLAKKLKISYGALLDLNPELQRGVTPPGKHVIRIPSSLLIKAGIAGQPEAMSSNQQ
jgi:membrane-bound lytic murein transglycosylase D